MRARHVSPDELAAMLDPAASGWKAARAERVKLVGTPLALQPTAAIQAAWKSRKIGAVDHVEVAAVHDGARLALRLEWPDATENLAANDTVVFPDAAAVVFPAAAGAPLISMGAVGLPVNAWYWRADETRGREVVAEGIGTSRTLEPGAVEARGAWTGGRWRVVIARALEPASSETVARLEPGRPTRFGVAVWEGSSSERAGIKAFSGDWRELSLDGSAAAKKG